MFAFAVYDVKKEKVFAARDPLGVKPLYYAFCNNNNFYLASEIKALISLPGIKKIHEFPPGNYFYKGKFHKYFHLPVTEKKITREDASKELSILIEDAVKKRVQTTFPIAVFLSGGVDSSLVMELATRFHPDVTALILGYKDSSVYKAAIGLCRKKKWKYKIVDPDIDYEKELPGVIYHLETYDPNIVRHSFANNVISKFAHNLGYKVVLTGEGSDEIFAGYNEFLEIDKSKINLGCKMLLDSMSKGNLMRIDKLAMRHAVETRCPFFDTQIVKYAMSLPGSFKVGKYKGKDFTKMILRRIASKCLPKYIAYREKVPFANGAGMKIGMNYTKSDGLLSELAEKLVSDAAFSKIQKDNPDYKIKTKEEALFLSKYLEFGYDKFVEGRERLVVKDVLYTI